MFVEVHMIQNFAPANLNRDDTNNPKDCEFGGVRRARISSQCLKRAIRRAPVFAQTTGVDIGTRTKYVLGRLRAPLLAAGKPADQVDVVLQAFVPQLFSKLDKDGKRTAVLLYLSHDEVARLSQQLLESWSDLADEERRAEAIGPLIKSLVKELKDRTGAPDIALFGRMLAEKPELNLEAACQVAHAISTHRVTMEMDFYTAVDDLNPEDTAGVGMMGFTGFDSACFYRYARLDWDQLVKNLDGDGALARRSVEGFLRAAVSALPTGKQNTFAAHNPPSFLLAVVRREGMGWSLANAFERPVRPRGDEGLTAPSVEALDGHWGRLCQVYGTADLVRTVTLALDSELSITALQGTQVETLEAWVGAVLGALPA
jgi:CRISPR system Cascade subunit CasC